MLKVGFSKIEEALRAERSKGSKVGLVRFDRTPPHYLFSFARYRATFETMESFFAAGKTKGSALLSSPLYWNRPAALCCYLVIVFLLDGPCTDQKRLVDRTGALGCGNPYGLTFSPVHIVASSSWGNSKHLSTITN